MYRKQHIQAYIWTNTTGCKQYLARQQQAKPLGLCTLGKKWDIFSQNNHYCNENLKLFTVAELTEKGVNLTLENIFFDTNKAILKKESYSELNRVFALIKSNNFKIELFGHTDNVGKDDYNLQLSQRRADAVRRYLIEKGIPTADISAIGKGETEPIEDNTSEKGKAKNRRVEVKFRN